MSSQDSHIAFMRVMLPPAKSRPAVLGVLGEEINLSWFRIATDLTPTSLEATTVETIESLRTTPGANLRMFRTSPCTCLQSRPMRTGEYFRVSVAEKAPASLNTTSTRGTSLHWKPFLLSQFVTSPELENATSSPAARSSPASAAILEA